MASHGRARRDTERALENRTPFRRSGFAMSAIEGAVSDTGRMPEEFAQEYNDARDKIVFTVLSYFTPIAWVLIDGTVVVPRHRYSQTTSQHQSACRTYLR